MKINLIASVLHTEIKDSFLKSLSYKLVIDISPISCFTEEPILFYIQTGGTEGQFKSIFPKIPKYKPIYLIASKENNSLAASLEILSFLRANNRVGKIIHGDVDEVVRQLKEIENEVNLGVIGTPSDWLISSSVDYEKIYNEHSIKLIDIDLTELYEEIDAINDDIKGLETFQNEVKNFNNQVQMKMAFKIYKAIHVLIKRYDLSGLTIRCFDLIEKYNNTGCLALALLNKEGYVSACEGDIKSLLTMYFVRKHLSISAFQANPSSIDNNPSSITFAHCTIPFDMVDSFKFNTHFESGTGVAIEGNIKANVVTIIKIDFENKEYACFESNVLPHQYSNNLCRTQIKLETNNDIKEYFFNRPIANHHILLFGKYQDELEKQLSLIGFKNII